MNDTNNLGPSTNWWAMHGFTNVSFVSNLWNVKMVTTNDFSRFATSDKVFQIRSELLQEVRTLSAQVNNLRYDMIVAWCLIVAMIIGLLWRTRK